MSEPNDLAAFLRARRERLTPAEVGLPAGGRRRTPGLRREEVATLAGVSIDYLIRLEQGKDTHPSGAVVKALADALRLSESERLHLFELAAITGAPELCPEAGKLATEVRPTLVQLLDQLDATPAFVLNPLNDVLAWNDAWSSLVAFTGLTDDPAPNLVRFVFESPDAPTLFRDWDRAADEQVAHLRAVRPKWLHEPRFVELVDALSANPEFTVRWDAHAVAQKGPSTKRIHHPELGALRVDFEVLVLPDDDQRLVTWHAADGATAERLRTLGERPVSPAQLRVVGPA